MLITLVCLSLLVVQTTVCNSVHNSAQCVVQFTGDDNVGVGVLKTTLTNTSFCEYRGVRYGETTAGERRFRSPVAYFPKGRENYTALGNICPQLDDINYPTKVLGDEDCLNMNIFSPAMEADRRSGKSYPVLVFIHGGSFTIGSNVFDSDRADLLIDNGILVVSINYRLDVLGFLHYPKFNISGNNGLKDQLAALRWINQHIRFFGGDPSKITLMGQSSGAASVNYHMYSEQSKKLFQQAAILSGSFLAPWAFCYDFEKNAEYYFRHLGVSTREELVQRDFKDFFFLNATSRLFGMVFASMQFPSFVPTFESPTSSDAFLTAAPHDLFANKPIHDIPLLVGHTSTEFELLLNYVQDYSSWDENFPNQRNKTLLLYIESFLRAMADHTQEVALVKDRFEFFRKIANLANVDFPIEHFLEHIAQKGQSAPVFMYRFEFDGKFGHYKNVFYRKRVDRTRYGAIHGDDLGYIFSSYNVDQALERRDEFQGEWMIHEQMAKMVSRFVKFGNPSSKDVDWRPYNSSSGEKYYLNINHTFVLKTKSNNETYYYEFWKNIYNCYYYYQCSLFEPLDLSTNSVK
ncbi:esterase E4-like [Toxorhynchites rutilus septentrionalis]|uniref:esterase E4-like n=1 Tax=Toxorhynchites rutilus septentrionalis TaxID=329112 RepID=UPI002479265B|nr:esterase E4-like [Toxorhynchites rutilus septentrionalis]